MVLEGRAVRELPRLAARLGARIVSHARNHEPAARRRERGVAEALARDGVAVRPAEAALVQPPGAIVTKDGGSYRVYSAFARAWEAAEVASSPHAAERGHGAARARAVVAEVARASAAVVWVATQE